MNSPDSGGRPLGVGSFIRRQRELAQLSLRQLARLSNVSNAYLSQIERGLHEPSVRVLTALADALSVPIEDLMAGVTGSSGRKTGKPKPNRDLNDAIRAEPNLTDAQKDALIAVYRGFLDRSSTGPRDAHDADEAEHTDQP